MPQELLVLSLGHRHFDLQQFCQAMLLLFLGPFSPSLRPLNGVFSGDRCNSVPWVGGLCIGNQELSDKQTKITSLNRHRRTILSWEEAVRCAPSLPAQGIRIITAETAGNGLSDPLVKN